MEIIPSKNNYDRCCKRSSFKSASCTNFDFLAMLKFRLVYSILFFVPLLLMVVAYVHIFVIVRQHLRGVLQNQNRKQLNRNVKAIFTTLLILGTYVVGWMPAIIFALVTCLDCAYPYTEMYRMTVIRITFTTNSLIILKSLLDPIIYAARMKEIQEALHPFFCCSPCCRTCLGADGGRLTGRNGRSARSGRDDSSSFASRCETNATSIRLKSVRAKSRDGRDQTPVLVYQTTTNHELNSTKRNGACSSKGNGTC